MSHNRASGGSNEADPAQQTGARPVRLPGFTAGSEVGLGEVVQRVTSSLGIPTCGGCARRAAALNRRVVFTGKHRT